MSKQNDQKDPTICPYCGVKMLKWQASDQNSWGLVTQWVCFNNECDYYKRGWKWMEERYAVKGSYRHRYNPETGEKGPLPVFSATALRTGIVEDTDETCDDGKEKE